MQESNKYDLIIIGAGPAGLTAALYAGRYRLNTLVLEKLSVGGQIILSSEIENYPGFPGGISTCELMDKFKQQVDAVGVKIVSEEVTEIIPVQESESPLYNIRTSERIYEAASVIIASGAFSKRLGVEGENRLIGKGVSYCGTCDGPLFKGKDIVLVGGGDRAIEEAIFLAGYAKKVTVVHRRQELRASKILEEKAKQNPKINFVLDSALESIEGEAKVEGVKVKNVKTGEQNIISCHGVFIFVGFIPNTRFLGNLVQLDENGFITTDDAMKASSEGVFACGDCRKKSLYQVVTACGDGAQAAEAAYKYISNKEK